MPVYRLLVFLHAFFKIHGFSFLPACLSYVGQLARDQVAVRVRKSALALQTGSLSASYIFRRCSELHPQRRNTSFRDRRKVHSYNSCSNRKYPAREALSISLTFPTSQQRSSLRLLDNATRYAMLPLTIVTGTPMPYWVASQYSSAIFAVNRARANTFVPPHRCGSLSRARWTRAARLGLCVVQ